MIPVGEYLNAAVKKTAGLKLQGESIVMSFRDQSLPPGPTLLKFLRYLLFHILQVHAQIDDFAARNIPSVREHEFVASSEKIPALNARSAAPTNFFSRISAERWRRGQ